MFRDANPDLELEAKTKKGNVDEFVGKPLETEVQNYYCSNVPIILEGMVLGAFTCKFSSKPSLIFFLGSKHICSKIQNTIPLN